MRYRCVLFDLDHTLFDSDASEAEALELALRPTGVELSATVLAQYRSINARLWHALEQRQISLPRLRVQRFEELATALAHDWDVDAIADEYTELLGSCGGLLDGARETLAALGPPVRLGLVTNGVAQTQLTRIRRLDIASAFAAVVISGEFGSAKPGTEIFDEALRRLGDPPRDTTLMVGDSLTSDMQGAHNSGLASCWFNPGAKPLPSGGPVTHEIQRLEQVVDLVLTR